MAALSPALENAVSLWLVVFLAALLALALAAVITSSPQTGSPPAEGGDAEPYLPRHVVKPPASPLPRRVAGQSGVVYRAGDPGRAPGVIRPPGANGGPPWGPAPKPAPAQYGGQVVDATTRRTWRCAHNHPTLESAIRCADFMQEQIRRLGWDKATGQRLEPGPPGAR